MHLFYECPECQAANAEPDLTAASLIRCRSCGWERPAREAAIDGGRLNRCAVCGTRAMYLQKDFPHRLGLAIVVIGFALSTWAYSQYWTKSALVILMAFAALDLVIYRLVGDVTVCYRCAAQYRGVARHPDHHAFDLGIGERFRQERIRLKRMMNSER